MKLSSGLGGILSMGHVSPRNGSNRMQTAPASSDSRSVNWSSCLRGRDNPERQDLRVRHERVRG